MNATPVSQLPSGRGAPPPGYREAAYWHLSDQLTLVRTLVLNGLALLLMLVGLIVALAWRHGWGLGTEITFPLWAFIGGLLLMYPLHEAIHGLAMRWHGAHPHFGLMRAGEGLVAFYTTAPGYAFPRSAYLVISLAPLVGVSVLALIGLAVVRDAAWAGLFTVMLAGNLAGSIGDLWIVLIALRYPKEAYIVDERDGMRLYLPQEDRALEG